MEKARFVEIVNKMKGSKNLYYLPQNSANGLKNWLEYKYPQLLHNKQMQQDLDVSEQAIVTYGLELIKFMENEFSMIHEMIALQTNEQEKFRILYDPELRGDWLTSPLHIIKLYMGLQWESEMNNQESMEYKRLFQKITTKHMLYSPTGNWESYVYENVDIIWNAFHKEAKRFINNVVRAGNFIMMPIYINPCRCMRYGGDDTFDTLMWKMYSCFMLVKDEEKLRKYMNESFIGGNEEKARVNVIKWMKLYNFSWDDFIKYNYLDCAVESSDDQYGCPIDFRTGKAIDCEIGTKYDPMPQNLDQCIAMMKRYNECIDIRTNAIGELINGY